MERRTRPSRNRRRLAATGLLALSIFSCSYGDREDKQEDEKAKQAGRGRRAAARRPAAGPARAGRGNRRGHAVAELGRHQPSVSLSIGAAADLCGAVTASLVPLRPAPRPAAAGRAAAKGQAHAPPFSIAQVGETYDDPAN